MPEIIFDSCCLSNFALSDSILIARDLYGGSVFITEFAAAEILQGIRRGHKGLVIIKEALQEGWFKEVGLRTKKEKSLFETLSVSLGLGEASSIAVAKARGFIFASDDKVARRDAELLEIGLTGTIGILRKAVRNDVIDLKQGNLILREMVVQGFYSPVSSLSFKMP